MPCDAIAVMTVERLQARAMDKNAQDVARMLNDHKVSFDQQTQSQDMGATQDAIWFFLQTKPLTTLVVTAEQITCTTQDGTFAVGKETLENILRLMVASGMDVQQVGDIETHIHEKQGQAPQQAYAQAKQLN